MHVGCNALGGLQEVGNEYSGNGEILCCLRESVSRSSFRTARLAFNAFSARDVSRQSILWIHDRVLCDGTGRRDRPDQDWFAGHFYWILRLLGSDTRNDWQPVSTGLGDTVSS